MCYLKIIFYNREVGNKWALEEAKRNLQRYYLLVGVTEELAEFVQILQIVFPRFFKGAYESFLYSKMINVYILTSYIGVLLLNKCVRHENIFR